MSSKPVGKVLLKLKIFIFTQRKILFNIIAKVILADFYKGRARSGSLSLHIYKYIPLNQISKSSKNITFHLKCLELKLS